MLRLRKVALLTLALVPFISNAKTEYVPTDNSLSTKLCISAAVDSPIGFHVKSKDSGYRLSHIANKVRCNDETIGDFAYKAGNAKNAQRLHKFQRVKTSVEIRDQFASLNTGDSAVLHIRGSE